MEGKESYKEVSLEESLTQFDMGCLLEELDIRLEKVRRNKETKEELLLFLESADKNLLKQSLPSEIEIRLSQIQISDKAIGENKSDREIANAEKLQVALNATRKMLQALTKAFLEDIDIRYRYAFFAEMNISNMVNEKEIDEYMKNVQCKLSFLSEVKRVYVFREIRKFLTESRECLRSFLIDNKEEFEKHRIHAIEHLHECIKGYYRIELDCQLFTNVWRSKYDISTRSPIQKIGAESRRKKNILQVLAGEAEKSLDGSFKVIDFLAPQDEYHAVPFVYYINVIVMCSSVFNGKSENSDAVKERLKGVYTTLSSCLYELKEQSDVEIILQRKGLDATKENILSEIKDAVEKIMDYLAEKFNINTYKEGKSSDISRECSEGCNACTFLRK